MNDDKQRPFSPTPTPAAQSVDGPPEDVEQLINKYGTYEVQDTADTENIFPTIATGLPKNGKFPPPDVTDHA